MMSEGEERRDDDGKTILYCLLVIFVLEMVVFRSFLFSNAVYLYTDLGGDSINFTYPHLYHLFDYLHKTGIPGWSFNQGMGQNIYPFSWNDPFFLILFLFGKNNLAFGLIDVELAKILVAGIFFYHYLRTLSFGAYASLVGGILFSFSGFIIAVSCWSPIFSLEAVYLALMLYVFEKALKMDSWILLPLPIGLLALLQPFYLYPYGLFFVFYGTARFIDAKGWNAKNYFIFLFKLAGLGLIGVLISGVYLLSDVLQMFESPRVSGAVSYFKMLSARPVLGLENPTFYLTALYRFFSDDISGTAENFGGWGNYFEAPFFYCGLASLLLAPQAFARMDGFRRKLYGALVFIFLLPFVLPYFRYAFWAFTGIYCRAVSFFLAVILLHLSARALGAIEKNSEVHVPCLLLSLGAWLSALFLFSMVKTIPVDPRLRNIAAAFLVGYAALIFMMSSKISWKISRGGFLILICLEAAYFSNITVNHRDFLTTEDLRARIGYNDYTNEAVAYLKSIDPAFYRVNKDYSSGLAMHLSLNDGIIQDYYGISSYTEFNQKYYIRFLQEMAVINPLSEVATRWAVGLGHRRILCALAGVKYFLSKNPKNDYQDKSMCDFLGIFGDVRVYKGRYNLPLGFTYDRYIPLNDMRKLGSFQKDIALLNAFVVEDGQEKDFSGFKRASADIDASSFDDYEYRRCLNILTRDTLSISEHSQNDIKGKINSNKKELLFFSIPYDEGWRAAVDGHRVQLKLVNIGFMGLVLEKGSHNIELHFEPPFRKIGAFISLAGLALYGLALFVSRGH